MKIINPGVEYIPQTDNTLKGIYEQIEKAGRTCYKSEDKITEGSAEAFVQHMIESNHTAMLEHGTVYIKMTISNFTCENILRFPWYCDNKPTKLQEIFGYVQSLFLFNPYSVVNIHYDKEKETTTMCITTNYRVIVENCWDDIMNELICEPTEWHTPRITLKFTTNIGVTREGNRMRANSIAEESTRYCNYTKEKFGSELNICPPVWLEKTDVDTLTEHHNIHWVDTIKNIAESIKTSTDTRYFPIHYYAAAIVFSNICYNNLIRLGWKPQQAREVLPLATKSDVVYTAFPHQWRHFFDLRLLGTTGIPHPNMKQITELASKVLLETPYGIDDNLWNLIYPPETPVEAPKQD